MSSLIVYAVGCVIPTPLEAETTPVVGQPVITQGLSPGDFGQAITISPQAQNFKLSFNAVDTDLDEQLYAFVYFVNGDPTSPTLKWLPLQGEVPMVPTAADPSVRTAEFTALTYCCFMATETCTKAAFDQLVYAYAAKQSATKEGQFFNGPPEFDGLFARDHWSISCQ